MIERVNSEIQKEFSAILIKKEINDPRVTRAFITVTGVDCAKDQNAMKIYISVLKGDKKEVLEGLKSATPYIKGLLFKRVRLRRSPDIFFKLDESEEKAQIIENLLKKNNET